MTFGEKVRELRKKKGLKQSELAAKLNVTTRTVQSYEGDFSFPKQRELYSRLSEILECDKNYLLTDDSFTEKAKEIYGQRGEKQAKELVSEIGGLFAGGDMAEEDMEEMMKAIQEAYWIAKENNRKYIPKKYKK